MVPAWETAAAFTSKAREPSVEFLIINDLIDPKRFSNH